MILVLAFVLGYVVIASEYFVKVNKAATALLMGVLCWQRLDYRLGRRRGRHGHGKDRFFLVSEKNRAAGASRILRRRYRLFAAKQNDVMNRE